jgi:hypothetical protein
MKTLITTIEQLYRAGSKKEILCFASEAKTGLSLIELKILSAHAVKAMRRVERRAA